MIYLEMSKMIIDDKFMEENIIEQLKKDEVEYEIIGIDWAKNDIGDE